MSDELKSVARQAYFSARQQQSITHWAALAVVLPYLQHHLAKQRADLDHGVQGAVLATLPTKLQVDDWAAEEAWDAQFGLMQQESFRDNLRAPDDEEDRYRLRLDVQMQTVEFNEGALRQVQSESERPDFVFTEAYLQKLGRAQSAYTQACRELERLEDQARQRLLEIPSGPAALADIAARKRRLMDHYGDLGPQYEILCEALADLEYQREQTRRSGRNVPVTEIVSLNDSLLRTINQLQKFTETTKSESLSKNMNEMGAALMLIVEKHFATAMPRQFAAMLAEIKQRLGTPELSPPPLRLVPTEASSTYIKEE